MLNDLLTRNQDRLANRGLLTIDMVLDLQRRLVTAVDGTEVLPLLQAIGRVLVEPIYASGMTPPFDNAAMDGYAVCTTDLTGNGPWDLPVRGRIKAGDGGGAALMPGSACQIFTGAMLPKGADAVVMQEAVSLSNDTINLRRGVVAGENIRRAGEDMKQGDVILQAGCRLGPRQIAALSAAGISTVTVVRPVRVAILATGDELTTPGAALDRAAIWDVNTPMLIASLATPQVTFTGVETGKDSVSGLAAQLIRLSIDADLIISTGGISVGEADHVKPALLEAGGTIAFSGVAIKPGKPVSGGRLGSAVWLGLPGNPLSAFVTWQVFGHRLLSLLMGSPQACASARRHVVANAEVLHRPGRCEGRLAKIIGVDAFGREVASCAETTHSGRVGCLAQADGLVMIPADLGHLPAGSLLEYFPFNDL